MHTNTTRLMLLAAVLACAAMLIGAGCPPPTRQSAQDDGGARADNTSAGAHDTGTVQEDEGMVIKSGAFRQGDELPEKYTADGENISPPLTFVDVPRQTKELALIMHDPDAPVEGGYTHWLLWDLAPHIPGLPGEVPATEEVERIGAIQGSNSAGEIGYTGPAPPEGDAPHNYEFTVYALSEKLGLEPGATKDELDAAMEGNIIEEATLTVTFGR
ncbi:MAG: YbhB/YbcL family Raf kinase inhibitor-like protein [Armatimonadota bacterium]